MFLNRARPSRLVSSSPISRYFSTTTIRSLQIQKTFIDDESLERQAAENKANIKRQFAADLKRHGGRTKTLYFIQKARDEKAKALGKATPAKLSHPLLVIDVSSFMSLRFQDKYFSHIAAAKDFHHELRTAMQYKGAPPKHVDIEVTPKNPPKIEIALVLERYFRQGAYEGTLGNKEIWLRTVHATNRRITNQNAGDDTVVHVAGQAREEGREVTVVTKDRSLSARCAALGCLTLGPTPFLEFLEAYKVPSKEEEGLYEHFGTQLARLAREKAKKETLQKTFSVNYHDWRRGGVDDVKGEQTNPSSQKRKIRGHTDATPAEMRNASNKTLE